MKEVNISDKDLFTLSRTFKMMNKKYVMRMLFQGHSKC